MKFSLNGLVNLSVTLLFLAGNAFSDYKVHILSPWANDPTRQPYAPYILSGVFPALNPPGAKMTLEADNWYVYTIATNATPQANAQFYFQSYIPTANNPTANPLPYFNNGQQFIFSDTFFKLGVDEIWIIPQGDASSAIVTAIPQAKKVAFLFNPWPDNAPMAKVGNAAAFGNMIMSPDAKRCGWYGAYFMAAPFSVSFKAIFGTETYGLGGLGDSKAIDLSSYFATADTIFIQPDPIPGGPAKITTSIPVGVVGQCSFPLAVTVRDFSIQHPDFEKSDMNSDVATTGLVQSMLDTASKPVRSAKPYNRMSDFFHWFRDDSTAAAPLTNYTTCRDLPMSKSAGGLWSYNSFVTEPSHSYFPIDDFNRFNETAASQYIDPTDGTVHNDPTGKKHNFSFCMEMHATFKYQQGQQFHFLGDDDTWAFINKKLVMDLGGPHPPLDGRVNLDTIPGLVAGNEYPFDFFFCERHTTGSDLTIETSIFFEQQQSVYAVKQDLTGGSVQYDIFQKTSGDRSCSAPKDGSTAPAPSTFKLSGPSVNPAQTLPSGVSFGGITINPGMTQVIVDTSKVTGLAHGVYSIVYTTASGQGSTIQFTVTGKLSIEFASKNPVNVLLGTSIPVTVRAMSGTDPDQRAEIFRLAPAADLLVFADSALTVPITASTDLSTDSATGTKKVFVTSRTVGTYSLGLLGGPTKAATMDTYNNIAFYDRSKVATPAAAPAGQSFSTLSSGLNVTLSDVTDGSTIFYTLDGSTPDTVAGAVTKQYSPGSLITVNKSMIIKAVAIKQDWYKSEVMSETYKMVDPGKVAEPVADPASQNFLGSLNVTLSDATPGASILYTLDGTQPGTAPGGSTNLYLGPITLTDTAVITAVGVKTGMYPSDTLVQKYFYVPPIKVSQAWYLDSDGDGRIDKAVVLFAAPLPQAPDKLAFKIVAEDAQVYDRAASGPALAWTPGDAMRVTVTFAEPFPKGVTSLTNAATSGQSFRQDAIPLEDGFFPVADSVPPIISKAVVKEPGDGDILKRLLITFSEPVVMSSVPGNQLILKRETMEFPAGDFKYDRIEKVGDQDWVFHVDSLSNSFPIVGDSAAASILGEVKDVAGNQPSIKHFQVLEGKPGNPKPVELQITFPNGSQSIPSQGAQYSEQTYKSALDRLVVFIPMDKDGAPLQGDVADGKCPDCVGKEGALFVGPVFHIITPGPVDYDFKIFNTLGEFVAQGSGRINQTDLMKVRKSNDASGLKYDVPIVWSGATRSGNKAGTGAYILKALFITGKNLTTGAAPAQFTDRKVFGLMRNSH